MKKKGINLLVDTYNYRKTELFFLRLRIAVLAYGCILLILAFAAFLKNVQENRQLESLQNEKAKLLESLTQKADIEVQVNLLNKKAEYVEKFLKNDAHFLPYYNLLAGTFKESSASSSIDSFQIDRNRNTEFKVLFPSLDQLMIFFKLVEEDTFLKKFKNLTMNGFSAASTGLKNYELSFQGTFNILNETQN